MGIDHGTGRDGHFVGLWSAQWRRRPSFGSSSRCHSTSDANDQEISQYVYRIVPGAKGRGLQCPVQWIGTRLFGKDSQYGHWIFHLRSHEASPQGNVGVKEEEREKFLFHKGRILTTEHYGPGCCRTTRKKDPQDDQTDMVIAVSLQDSVTIKVGHGCLWTLHSGRRRPETSFFLIYIIHITSCGGTNIHHNAHTQIQYIE
mmetsp:Transcript_3662/g.7671  ORF Transcript_3662/g.7671 Transcript_3662/m.7671 type:complete len:201 (-) Transcript_3662:463-1065(-)